MAKIMVFWRNFFIIFIFSVLTMVPIVLSNMPNLVISSYGRVNYNSSGLKWLHTDGKWIKDSDGNVVILRGANFMGYEFGAWDSHTEEDYARMASWGFNVVRLPIAWHYIEPKPEVYNLSYFENTVDRDIQWAEKYGIYVILDMHQWRWSPYFNGNGMPTWLVSGYPKNDTGMMQAITDFWLDKAPNGTDPLENNPSMQDRFIAMWKLVASRYADKSVIAAYDLFNEPPLECLLDTFSNEEVNNILYSFYSKLIAEIRNVDQKHILIYETYGPFIWQRKLPIQVKLINESNVAISFHFYHFRSGYSGNITWLRYMFSTWWWEPIKNWDIPTWIGEFGAFMETPNATLWVRDIVSIFEEHKLGWAWWTYWKSDTYSSALLYANGTERIEWLQYLKQM